MSFLSGGSLAAPEPRDEHPGRIGPFEIVGVLGRGGMGVVFDALTQDGQRVALKVIRPQGDADQAQLLVARFLREAKILSELNHPCVVRLVDSGEVDGTLFLAMQRIEGVSLLTIRRRGPLGFDALVQLGIQLADALQHLHQAGVIHRDIKPANILIDGSGHPVITDFGISGMNEATGITRMGDLLGSPGFMAPEVTEGAPPSELSDQFALGRLLYELGAIGPAKRLPKNAPLFEILSASLEIDWNRFPKSDRWPSLEPILRRMLATDPRGRYPSAADAKSALQVLTSSDLLDLETLSEHIGNLGVKPRMSWDLGNSGPDGWLQVMDPREDPKARIRAPSTNVSRDEFASERLTPVEQLVASVEDPANELFNDKTSPDMLLSPYASGVSVAEPQIQDIAAGPSHNRPLPRAPSVIAAAKPPSATQPARDLAATVPISIPAFDLAMPPTGLKALPRAESAPRMATEATSTDLKVLARADVRATDATSTDLRALARADMRATEATSTNLKVLARADVRVPPDATATDVKMPLRVDVRPSPDATSTDLVRPMLDYEATEAGQHPLVAPVDDEESRRSATRREPTMRVRVDSLRRDHQARERPPTRETPVQDGAARENAARENATREAAAREAAAREAAARETAARETAARETAAREAAARETAARETAAREAAAREAAAREAAAREAAAREAAAREAAAREAEAREAAAKEAAREAAAREITGREAAPKDGLSTGEMPLYRMARRRESSVAGESQDGPRSPEATGTEAQIARLEWQIARLKTDLERSKQPEAAPKPAGRSLALGAFLIGLSLVVGLALGLILRPGSSSGPGMMMIPQTSPSPAEPIATYVGLGKPSDQDIEEARELYAAATGQLDKRDLIGAEASLGQCITAADLPECHKMLGTLLALTRSPAARAHFERYLQVAPNAPDAEAIRRFLDGR